MRIGVSGDGDTASIGLGQFMHMVRRNVPMVYIIENNGVYGLTKGQFSATADEGSKLKTGVLNDLPPIDLCALAVELGCGFVARSFAGDPKQMVDCSRPRIAHNGTAVIDIISPCVTFNNHEGSTKSYTYAKEHQELLHQIGFVPRTKRSRRLRAGHVRGSDDARRLDDHPQEARRRLRPQRSRAGPAAPPPRHGAGQMLTGLVHLRPEKKSFISLLNVVDEPLGTLPLDRVRPPKEVAREDHAGFDVATGCGRGASPHPAFGHPLPTAISCGGERGNKAGSRDSAALLPLSPR